MRLEAHYVRQFRCQASPLQPCVDAEDVGNVGCRSSAQCPLCDDNLRVWQPLLLGVLVAFLRETWTALPGDPRRHVVRNLLQKPDDD